MFEYEKILRSLGYHIIQKMEDASFVIYLVEHGRLCVIKCNREDMWREQGELLRRENHALGLIEGIEGTPRRIYFHDISEHSPERLSFLIREYIPGNTLYYTQHLEPEGFQHLGSLVNGIHDRGICRLDLRAQNVVVDKHGMPHLFDLDTALLLDEMTPLDFAGNVYMDFYDLANLRRNYMRTKAQLN